MNPHKYISNLSLHVSANSTSLTAMEKDMVQKLMKHRQSFTYKSFTIAHISETLNVSSTSLHRLSRKLGYPSFALLKEDYFTVPQAVAVEKQPVHHYETGLAATCSLVREALQDELVQTMVDAKRVTIYGMGISGYIAKIFRMKLELAGILAQQYDDSRFMRISSRNLKKDQDTIIILSRSGCPPELIEVAMEANKHEVPSILISEAQESPLESMATYVIHTAMVSDPDESIDTRIHAHIAMDMLMERVVELRKRST